VSGQNQASAFVPLPSRHGDLLRILGPKPQEAGVAVEPLVKLDEPVGVVQAFIGGLCTGDGRLVQPMEIGLVLDPAATVAPDQIPVTALFEMFSRLPELLAKLPVLPGFELVQEALAGNPPLGPLFYCRKRHCIFEARSRKTGEPLSPLPQDQASPASDSPDTTLPLELLSWDGPPKKGRSAVVYGGSGGSCALGEVQSLDQLMLDQGGVARRAARLAKSDPVAGKRIASKHACCRCSERKRCYPAGEGYAYAADRLAVIGAARAPLVAMPLGEWRLDEAAAFIGGLPPGELFRQSPDPGNEFEAWRRERAVVIEQAGPPWLLAGEPDGRELLEVARLKLGMIADVLEQLDAVWQATGRPHLCWNDETVRVAWRRPNATPAACWGFQPLLRKVGLHPLAPVETPDERPLPYPPALSDTALLAAEVADAARYFDEPRAAAMYVKSVERDGDAARVHVLLEDFGVAWSLCRTGDVLKVAGEGWEATLVPAAERGADEGEGWPCSGRAVGKVSTLKEGTQLDGCTCRWYPRFDQAVDLHAVGMLLFETLLAHDERSGAALRELIAAERAELTPICQAVPREQREQKARGWIMERCEADAPAAIWSRRNLLHRHSDRVAERLDAFPPGLWQAIVTFGLRLTTNIAGFSFCLSRDHAAPRIAGDVLLPLVELRGLISLLDDLVVARRAPAEQLRESLRAAD
jgi:hypothetical protein